MPSKWRPQCLNALYVISDTHGRLQQLNLILDRILPLRKSDGGKDRLIMLGDYIDRDPDSHLVIDKLIELKKKYKDKLILLRGNHELMFLDGIKASLSSDNYMFWMKNGGEQTLSGYLKRGGQPMDNPYVLPRPRIIDFIPKEHIEFIENELVDYYHFQDEMDEFFFAHAGFDTERRINNQQKHDLIWGNGLYTKVKEKANDPLPCTIVTGHYWDGPYITKNFMMLDCYNRKELLAVELRSMEAYAAKPGYNRLLKVSLEDMA